MQPLESLLEQSMIARALRAVTELFAEMQSAYQDHARAYGFDCHGCDDNCCATRFYHHTLLELIVLQQGLATLSADRRMRVRERSREICRIYRDRPAERTGRRVMCPLNEDRKCILYPYRPMICRLHGIPHELKMPAGGVQHHPGCHWFSERVGSTRPRGAFDRTPFYGRMAELEKGLRRELGLDRRIKLTVAEILLADDLLTRVSAGQPGSR